MYGFIYFHDYGNYDCVHLIILQKQKTKEYHMKIHTLLHNNLKGRSYLNYIIVQLFLFIVCYTLCLYVIYLNNKMYIILSRVNFFVSFYLI